jgi:hypothetical protein
MVRRAFSIAVSKLAAPVSQTLHLGATPRSTCATRCFALGNLMLIVRRKIFAAVKRGKKILTLREFFEWGDRQGIV